MPGLKFAKPVLGPLLFWSKGVIEESRKYGYEDAEIIQWIKAYAYKQGWREDQVCNVLLFHGIRRKNPCNIICPKCEDIGRLNIYHRRRIKVGLVITHGKLPGYWGTSDNTRVRRRKRCYLLKLQPEQFYRIQEQILEKLYINRTYGKQQDIKLLKKMLSVLDELSEFQPYSISNDTRAGGAEIQVEC
jgi:hypothetical protein